MGTVMTELGAGPDRPAPHTRLLVGAAVLAVALLAIVFVGLAAWGSTQDLADVREDRATARGPTLTADLLNSLQNERNYAATYILGAENVLVLPVDSMDAATAATDQALSAMRSYVERQGGDVADAYGPTLDGIVASLAELRQLVSAFTGERNQSQTAVTEPLYLGYTAFVDDLLAVADSLVLGIDDSELRQGAQLRLLATAQPELLGRITRRLLLAGVGPGGAVDTPNEVASIAADEAELEANETEIESLATGAYEDVTGTQADAAALSEFLSLVDSSTQGGLVPVGDVLAAMGTGPGLPEHYAAMNDAAETRLADRARDIEHEAESRRLLWFVLAGVSAAAVVLALVVLVR